MNINRAYIIRAIHSALKNPVQQAGLQPQNKSERSPPTLSIPAEIK
jgi:hypothetical protein